MEEKQVTITLLVPVYNGKEYWKECVKSIEEFSYLFDNILVSINRGETYLEDIETAKKITFDNTKIIIQENKLEAVNHFDAIIRKVTTDYVVILAHDDLILDGMKYLRESLVHIQNTDRISFLGTFHFFSDTQDIAVVKEIYNGCLKKEEFIEYDLAKHFNLNISGMCLPVKSILDNLEYLRKFVSGIRYDYLLLTNNKISKIYQLDKPTVKIRIHDNQEGKIIGSKGRISDSILYFMYHIIETKNLILKDKLKYQLISTVVSPLKKGCFYGVFFYLKHFVFFALRMGIVKFLEFNLSILILFFQKVYSKLIGRSK